MYFINIDNMEPNCPPERTNSAYNKMSAYE